MEWPASKIASAFKTIIRIYIGECKNSSYPLYMDELLWLNLKDENSPHRIIYFLVRTVVIRKNDFLIKKEKRKK